MTNRPATEADALDRDGFVVLRRFLDPQPLLTEMETAFAEGFIGAEPIRVFQAGRGTVTTQYLPMMCERTPVSLAQIDRLADAVAALLGRGVLPGRAKGSRYFGDSSWHRDSRHDIASVGCISYLEPVTAATGALRVIPGSHRRREIDLPATEAGEVGTAVETQPGDVIVFDEHLIHGSRGGEVRNQWRIDFIVDPGDAAEVLATRAWYEQSLPDAEPEAGYDPTLYPSWGAFWRSIERPWSPSLRRLGLDRWREPSS